MKKRWRAVLSFLLACGLAGNLCFSAYSKEAEFETSIDEQETMHEVKEDYGSKSMETLDDGVYVYNGHCYSLYPGQISWTESSLFCERLGGHLVTIADQEEQNLVETMLQDGTQNVYWIGLEKDNEEWKWVDGTPAEYFNWGPEEPNNVGNIQFYAQIFRLPHSQSEAGHWNDEGNEGRSGWSFFELYNTGFICEWDSLEDYQKYGKPKIDFNSSVNVTYNGHTYALVNESLKWEDAKKICKNSGGHLIVINDEEEQNFITSLLGSGTQNLYWMGLERVNDTWEWTDQTPFDYENWGVHEPNNYGGSENHAAMFRLPYDDAVIGEWADCDENITRDNFFYSIQYFGYICEWDSPVEINGYSMKVSLEGDLKSVIVNKPSTIQIVLTKNGTTVEAWEDYSLAYDPDSIKVADSWPGETGSMFFNIIPLKEGECTFQVSDRNSGAFVVLELTAMPETRQWTYPIDHVPTFKPTQFGDRDIETNVYNLNGLYINNYSCKNVRDEDGKLNYSVSFNVYNSKPAYASVDVYNAAGELIHVEDIAPRPNTTNLIEVGKGFWAIEADIYWGRLLSYTSETCTACTEVKDLMVPEGGFFTVSNNPLDSPGAMVFNSADVLSFIAGKVAGHLAKGKGDPKTTLIDLFTMTDAQFEKAYPSLPAKLHIQKNLTKSLQKSHLKVLEKYGKNLIDIAATPGNLLYLGLYADAGEYLFQSLGLNWKTVFSITYSIAESALLKLLGPAGQVMSKGFDMTELSEKMCLVIESIKAVHAPRALFYTSEASAFTGGISIVNSPRLPKSTTLQVIKVYDPSIVSEVIDEETKDYQLFNISLLKDGKNISPSERIKVAVNVPEGMDIESLQLYRQEEDGSWTLLDIEKDISHRIVFFWTDHFSLYLLSSDSEHANIDELTAQFELFKKIERSRIPEDQLTNYDQLYIQANALILEKPSSDKQQEVDQLTNDLKNFIEVMGSIKQNLSAAKVTNISNTYQETGSAIVPKPRVELDGIVLREEIDYNLSYSNNKTPGTATITITGVGSYEGTKTVTFMITRKPTPPAVKANLSGAKVTGVNASYQETGSAITPKPRVELNGKVLTEGTDYKLSYSNNKAPGKATITIMGIGNYQGTKTVTFAITAKKKPSDQKPDDQKPGNQNPPAVSVKKATMHRLYNPNSGEHFYTSNTKEKDFLVSVGWKYEGTGWIAPEKSSIPVYRLYNPNAGDHHYTLDKNEKDTLEKIGWNYEGIGWYSDEAKGVPLYRQYNPNAKAGSHNYTTDKNENDGLVKLGWKAEGIGWYGVK